MIADQFLISSSTRAPLRIGVLLNGLSLPSWVKHAFDYIQKGNFATIEMLMIHSPANPRPEQPIRPKWWGLWEMLSDSERRKQLGYVLYQKFDQKYYGGTNHPTEQVDPTQNLAGIESLNITPVVDGFVHRFMPADIEKIRKRDLDVILQFGFNILRGDILSAARYGVWSYYHGDNDFYRGGPTLFWELYERSKISGVVLQALSEDSDAGQILAKALFSTVQGGISAVENRFTPYWGAAHLVVQKLYELHNYGWEHLERHSVAKRPYRGKRELYRAPTNWELARWLAPALAAKSARRVTRVFTGEKTWFWRIALRTGSHQQLHQLDQGDRSAFRWLMPPKGHFHADPFLIEDQGRTWMFFEDYIYCESKGAIVSREIFSNGEVGEMQTALRRPYHLSYPFVFKHDGTYYLIPESESNQTVELYRATDLSSQWSLQKVLFRGRAVDTTLFMDGHTFWFFTTLLAPTGDGACLCLFYSDQVDGEWHSHPANPISMDVRDARCAGRIFRDGEKVIRVSQDCSGKYGSAFSFREIIILTKTEYRETLLRTVAPWSESFCGTHTYDRCGSIEVIDGMTYVPASAHVMSADLPPDVPTGPDRGKRADPVGDGTSFELRRPKSNACPVPTGATLRERLGTSDFPRRESQEMDLSPPLVRMAGNTAAMRWQSDSSV